MRPLGTEVYNLQDYEATLLAEDPQYQDAQRVLLSEISRITRNTIVNILEIGGGSGLFTSKLASNLPDADVTVIEPDEEWFEVLKSRASVFSNATPELCTLEQFEGDSGTYDVCCASFALHHIRYENQQNSIRTIFELLRTKGHLIIVDKFIPTFGNENERQVGLKTYHGYFLSWKKQRGLDKGAEFEAISLSNNLDQAGDYKISLRAFDSHCCRYFDLLRRIRIAPSELEPEVMNTLGRDLRSSGFSVSAEELERIHHNVEQANWGIFVNVLQKMSSLKTSADKSI